MHGVALTRLSPSFEAEAAELAPWFSLSVYDFRMRVRAGLPALLARFADRAQSERLVVDLRSRGYGALHYTSDDVPGAGQYIVPREFQLKDGALSGVDEAGKGFRVPLADISALIRATSVKATESNTTTETTKFALGRALATGGVAMRKKVEHTSTSSTEDRESVLYVFQRSSPRPLLFRETFLHYQGLGAALKPVTSQNFLTLVALLRTEAAQAFYDERFLKQKRKVGIAAVSAVGKDVSVHSSNASDNDLGAYLLVQAHLDGQL